MFRNKRSGLLPPRHLICIIVAVSMASSANAQGSSPEVKNLSYDEAVQIALHDNVDLLALRDQEEAQKHQSKQALAPNEPVFSYTKNDVPGFSLTQTAAQTVYAIGWTLGFPGKALSNSAAIRHQAEATSEQALAQEINIMTSLSNNYVAFATNDAFHKFQLEEQHKDIELVKLIEKKFAASQASKVDLLNANVVVQQIAQSLLENQNEYEILLTQFRQIIRRPTDRTLSPRIPDLIIIPSVDQSFDSLVPIMLRNNHSVAAASRAVDGSNALVMNASLSPLPDIQLVAGLNFWLPAPAPNPGVTRDYTFGIAVAVPISFRSMSLREFIPLGKTAMPSKISMPRNSFKRFRHSRPLTRV